MKYKRAAKCKNMLQSLTKNYRHNRIFTFIEYYKHPRVLDA